MNRTVFSSATHVSRFFRNCDPKKFLIPLLSIVDCPSGSIPVERNFNLPIGRVGNAYAFRQGRRSSMEGTDGAFGNGRAMLHSASIEEVESVERYKSKIRVGKHEFIGDLTHPDGSPPEGPEPKELAIAAVGLCTSMTIRLYADRKQWPLERVRIEVKEISDRSSGHVPEGLNIELHLEGDLTQEQRDRLLQIAGKCPVKNMLLGKMPKGISNTLADIT